MSAKRFLLWFVVLGMSNNLLYPMLYAQGIRAGRISGISALKPLGVPSPAPLPQSAQVFERTGNLKQDILDRVAYLPQDQNRYRVPSSSDLDVWRQVIDTLYSGSLTTAANLVQGIAPSYKVVKFTDTSSGSPRLYYLLLEANVTATDISPIADTGWGVYVFDPQSVRDLAISVPHPKADAYTEAEGIEALINLRAKWLLLSTSHRCASDTISPCNGSSTACSDGRLHVSDASHGANPSAPSVTNTFQVAHEELAKLSTTTVVIQFHGNATCSANFVLGNGGNNYRLIPDGNVYRLKQNLAGVSSNIQLCDHTPGAGECDFCGTTSLQARYFNGSTANPCQASAPAPTTTERFIHIEQTLSMRQDPLTRQRIIQAIANTTFLQPSNNPSSCMTVSVSGPVWQNVAFAPAQNGTFTAEVDATALGNGIDAAVALSNGPQSDYTGLACIARFNSSGTIDARNGGSYSADSAIVYTADTTYHFRFVVNVPSHTYTVYVTPAGGAEQVVGLNYAFRTEQAAVSSLNNYSLFADLGAMQACSFTASCSTAAAGGGWINNAFSPQSNLSSAEFDATPSAGGIDAVIALSSGAQNSFQGFACLVRFNTSGTIDARNGGSYQAASSIPYAANTTYHFRLAVNVPAHTYSVYVRGPGAGEQVVGVNYAFRTEQQTVTSLNNQGLIVDSASGTARVCNFVISPASTLMSLYFDGGSRRGCTAGDYVQIDDSPDFSIPTTGELTIEVWIQPTAPNLEFPCPEPDGPSSPLGYLHWMGKGDDSGSSGNREWAMRTYDTRNTVGRANRTGIYVFNLVGGEGTASEFTGLLTAGRWVHVVAVVDRHSTKIYKDGVLKRCQAYNDGPPPCPNVCCDGVDFYIVPQRPANPSPVRIGTRDFASFFQGGMRNIRFWNRALSGSEVTALHGSNIVPRNGLVAEYLFDHDTGGVALDSTGRHNGVIRGATFRPLNTNAP